MTEEGKYIYCIINDNKEKKFDCIGLNNQEVELLSYKDIAAVVSNTPLINFDRLDKTELIKHVAVHQKVNEIVMEDCGVVPMTFGVIAPSQDEVFRILERAYLQFKTALKKAEGKVEFAVQVWLDKDVFISDLIKNSLKIQELKTEATLKRRILTIFTKLKLGKLIHQEIETRKQMYLKHILSFLKSSALDFTSNKLIEDDMIANFSFLIERDEESEFDRKMAELGEKYHRKLKFKYIGPMPPYSFVDINLSLGNFELVNEAKELLGLGEEAVFDEIKKAYYTLSHQYHPDRHQDNPEKEEQMKRVSQAYNILENYCQSWDQIFGKIESQKYSFREEDVKNSIIIR